MPTVPQIISFLVLPALVLTIALIPFSKCKRKKPWITILTIIAFVFTFVSGYHNISIENDNGHLSDSVNTLLSKRKIDSLKLDKMASILSYDSSKEKEFEDTLRAVYHIIRDSANKPILITNVKNGDSFKLKSQNLYKSPQQLGGNHNTQTITYP